MSAAAKIDLSVDLPDGVDGLRTIAIGSGLEPKTVIELHVDHGLSHVVQRDSLEFESEVRCAETIIADPRKFIVQPLDVVFGEGGTFTDFSLKVRSEERKKNVLEPFQEFLNELAGARAIREDAMLIADELYTNSARNGAPLVGEIRPQDVRPGWVQFVARSDGKRLVLGCIDSYGELEAAKLTRKILGCFRKGVAQSITQGTGGAGIGSFMVFNTAMSLYIGTEKGCRTIVLCSLPLNLRLKDMNDLPKNIHVCSIG